MLYRDKNNPIYIYFSSIRKGIFSIMRNSLENNVVNLTIYLIIIFYETYQVCLFFLSIGLRVTDGHPTGISRYKTALDTLSTISGNKIFLESNFYVITIFSFCVLAFHTLAFFIMVYIETKRDGKKKGLDNSKILAWTFKLLSLLFVLFGTYFSLSFFLWLFMIYACNDNGEDYVLNNDSSIVCWSGFHLAMVIINGVNILLHCIFLVIIETFFNDTSPRSVIPWASTKVNKMRLLKHISKITLALFTVFDTHAKLYNYLFVLEILIHCLIIYIIFISPSYISRIAGRSILFLELYILVTMISMYACRLTTTSVTPVVLAAIEVLLVVLSGIAVFVKVKYDRYILTIEVTTNRSESFKEYYFYELFRLLDNYGSGSASVIIDLYGIYTNHQLVCRNPSCFCSGEILNRNFDLQKMIEDSNNKDQEGPTPGGEGQYESLANTFRANLVDMFQIGMNKSIDYLQKSDDKQEVTKEEDIYAENYKLIINACSLLIDFEVSNNFGSIPLRMISAYCFREYIGNIFKSTYELIFIEEKQKPSLRDQFFIYKYKKSINEEIELLAKKAVADSIVNVEKIMEFETYYEKFRKQTEMASNIVNRFWEQLKSKDLDVNGLYEIGSKIGIIYKEMQANYNAALEIFPHNFKMFNEFGSFERNIMNNDMIANNYEMRARQIFKEQAEQNREGIRNYENNLVDANSTHHTFICVVSGNPNTMGDIVAVNTEIVQILGFKPKEIIGQNCGVLCPQYISSKHNQMLENFIMRGTSAFLKTRQILTACNSNGFLIMLESYIKLYPSINDGIQFIGIFKTLKDYAEFFKDAQSNYAQNDFAFIVTSPDGQVLGISENCMIRMGIPISLFKSKGVAEDPIVINTFIPELAEPNTEGKLLQEGMVTTCNTKALLLSINKENLTKKERKIMRSKAGKYKVFVRLSIETYQEVQIKVKIYKMIIISAEIDTNKEVQGYGERIILNANTSRSRISCALSPEEKEKGKQEDSDKDDGKSSDDEKKVLSPNNEKELWELKQNMNTKSSTINVFVIKCGINILFLVLVILASTIFTLLIIDQKRSKDGIKIVFYSNRRIIDLIVTHSVAFIMNYLAKNTSYNRRYGDVDLFEYAKEYGYRSIYMLKNEQNYLNTLDFDYSERLNNLEKNSIVKVIMKANDDSNYTTVSSINTAITQYSGQASNYFAYSYDDLVERTNMLPEYFFIKENGIGSISLTALQSEVEFRAQLKKRIGRHLYHLADIAIFIGVSTIILLAILVPKLISLQREKISVFMLYAQMNRDEVDIQMDKCIEYQKSKGFFDYDEMVDPDDSMNSSEDLTQDQNRTQAVLNIGIKQVFNNIVPEKKESEEESDSGSDSEDSEETERKENEITIQEHLDSKNLKSKLSTNAISLVIIMVLLSLIYFTYFIVSPSKHFNDIKNILDKYEFISGISGMINTPLFLIMHTLISASENRTIMLDNVDSISYYMDRFLIAINFEQKFVYSNKGSLKESQNTFAQLDSNQFCSTITGLYKIIQGEYGPQRNIYGYDMQNAISSELCSSYSSNLLLRGVIQAFFTIYYNVRKVRDERTISKTEYNLTSTVELLTLTQLFLAPAYEALILELKNAFNKSLNSLKNFLILFYVFYILISALAHFLFWTCYLRMTDSELVKSKGMLKIMPLSLIAKLKKMSRENEDNESVKFFKTFEKIY